MSICKFVANQPSARIAPAPLKWAAAERNDPRSVFGGEKAAAKIRTVKGLRVEIFSRCARKNTTRPLTVWIVGADEIFVCEVKSGRKT